MEKVGQSTYTLTIDNYQEYFHFFNEPSPKGLTSIEKNEARQCCLSTQNNELIYENNLRA